jgi:hypothetical protein
MDIIITLYTHKKTILNSISSYIPIFLSFIYKVYISLILLRSLHIKEARL